MALVVFSDGCKQRGVVLLASAQEAARSGSAVDELQSGDATPLATQASGGGLVDEPQAIGEAKTRGGALPPQPADAIESPHTLAQDKPTEAGPGMATVESFVETAVVNPNVAGGPAGTGS